MAFDPNQPRDEYGRWTDGLSPHIARKIAASGREEHLYNQVDDLMSRAREAGPEVDGLANDIAKKHGARVTPINYKSRESILRKARDEYGGDPSHVKDAVRNTIIVDSDEDIDRVLNDFSSRYGDRVKIKRQRPEEYLGYSGSIINFKAKNGTYCEIQVNTARMIYAKDTHAEAFLGRDTFNRIRAQYGVPPGRGHEFYEKFRVLKDPSQQKQREELERQSREYYAIFRK